MGYLSFLVLGGTGFLQPFFLEVIAPYSAAKVGLLLAIAPIVGGVTAPMGGALADRIGPRWVALTGLLLVAFGLLLFATIGAAGLPAHEAAGAAEAGCVHRHHRQASWPRTKAGRRSSSTRRSGSSSGCGTSTASRAASRS